MGFAQSEGLEHEERLQVATAIAIEAGALTQCEFHETVMNVGDDVQPAYALANVTCPGSSDHGLVEDGVAVG